ncbi:acylphosphatase [Peredibacter starrii]|uniref:Acylphosphatase n=1 Tax=Peredibacter starrii TaxID=28202 RepID=A0AAX4HS28_9BACT|nr:acylphosphatase [Peredibacter starrii]WPU66175.1 acylphosphatase [Peredibacter starrii]
MIARKITYRGNFNNESLGDIFNITRNNEITGLVKKVSDQEVELSLEGDSAQIKLIQHQIERKVKSAIKDKSIEPMPYQYYVGVTLLA